MVCFKPLPLNPWGRTLVIHWMGGWWASEKAWKLWRRGNISLPGRVSKYNISNHWNVLTETTETYKETEAAL
jgi:hypothetical protein